MDYEAHQALLQRSMHRVHIPHEDPPPEDEALSSWVAPVIYTAAAAVAAIVCGVIAALYHMGPGI